MAFFPQIPIETIESWDMDTLCRYAARAEFIMKSFRGMDIDLDTMWDKYEAAINAHKADAGDTKAHKKQFESFAQEIANAKEWLEREKAIKGHVEGEELTDFNKDPAVKRFLEKRRKQGM